MNMLWRNSIKYQIFFVKFLNQLNAIYFSLKKTALWKWKLIGTTLDLNSLFELLHNFFLQGKFHGCAAKQQIFKIYTSELLVVFLEVFYKVFNLCFILILTRSVCVQSTIKIRKYVNKSRRRLDYRHKRLYTRIIIPDKTSFACIFLQIDWKKGKFQPLNYDAQ